MGRQADALAAELRNGVANHDDHIRAAVELLIDHDYWLRNGRFVRAALVRSDDNSQYILWHKAREAFDAGEFDRSSTTERAMLEIAITLGTDQFRLTQMGRFNRTLITRAVAAAVGVSR